MQCTPGNAAKQQRAWNDSSIRPAATSLPSAAACTARGARLPGGRWCPGPSHAAAAACGARVVGCRRVLRGVCCVLAKAVGPPGRALPSNRLATATGRRPPGAAALEPERLAPIFDRAHPRAALGLRLALGHGGRPAERGQQGRGMWLAGRLTRLQGRLEIGDVPQQPPGAPSMAAGPARARSEPSPADIAGCGQFTAQLSAPAFPPVAPTASPPAGPACRRRHGRTGRLGCGPASYRRH